MPCTPLYDLAVTDTLPHRLTLHQHGRGFAQPSIPKYLILTEPYRGIRWLQRRWPVGITQRTCSAPLYLLLLLQPHRSRAGYFPNAQHTTASRPCCWTVSLSLTSLAAPCARRLLWTIYWHLRNDGLSPIANHSVCQERDNGDPPLCFWSLKIKWSFPLWSAEKTKIWNEYDLVKTKKKHPKPDASQIWLPKLDSNQRPCD